MEHAKKEAAEQGKEPFDLEALARVHSFASHEMAENPHLYAPELEEQYYVSCRKLMTLAEFAAYRSELDVYG